VIKIPGHLSFIPGRPPVLGDAEFASRHVYRGEGDASERLPTNAVDIIEYVGGGGRLDGLSMSTLHYFSSEIYHFDPKEMVTSDAGRQSIASDRKRALRKIERAIALEEAPENVADLVRFVHDVARWGVGNLAEESISYYIAKMGIYRDRIVSQKPQIVDESTYGLVLIRLAQRRAEQIAAQTSTSTS